MMRMRTYEIKLGNQPQSVSHASTAWVLADWGFAILEA
jgi:hypothetical protein